MAGKIVRMQHRQSEEVAANRVMSKKADIRLRRTGECTWERLSGRAGSRRTRLAVRGEGVRARTGAAQKNATKGGVHRRDPSQIRARSESRAGRAWTHVDVAWIRNGAAHAWPGLMWAMVCREGTPVRCVDVVPKGGHKHDTLEWRARVQVT